MGKDEEKMQNTMSEQERQEFYNARRKMNMGIAFALAGFVVALMALVLVMQLAKGGSF